MYIYVYIYIYIYEYDLDLETPTPNTSPPLQSVERSGLPEFAARHIFGVASPLNFCPAESIEL
jgi:hypothetical protein